MNEVSRRQFLGHGAAAAGALVIGFNPATRAWTTLSQPAGPLAPGFPTFDGALRTDGSARQAAADDFGHIVHRLPLAVLFPASTEDVVKLVRFARDHRIRVAGRGQGHSTYGQPQVDAGVVIDLSTLGAVHEVEPEGARLDGGATWRTLLEAALAHGLTPPTLTDYLDLSIGGTLSVGGIGGACFRHGAQVDNVLELEVVTGEGRRVTCSPSHETRLFEAVLAGLGQCALITSATVRLRRAPAMVRLFDLLYDDLQTYAGDARTVVRDGRFDTVQGLVVPGTRPGAPRWRFQLEATASFTPPAAPDSNALLAGLRDDRSEAVLSDVSYFDYANRLAPGVAALMALGLWSLPHPWFDVWVPDRAAETYAGEVLAGLTEADTGGGPILLYPTRTAPFTRPLLRLPAGELAWQFDILRTALPTSPAPELMVRDNRRLFEAVRDLGGYRYPVGAIPFSQSDWVQHFGPAWVALTEAKRRYDPADILTPGQGVFP